MSTGTPQAKLIRLPFAEDASAGERCEALARQAAAQAHNARHSVPARLQFARLADHLETVGALLEADDLLAANAGELA